jgi:transposase
MRFVPTKAPEEQSCLMLHRTRHLFVRQQTAVINSILAHLAEFGIVAPVGRKGVSELLHVVADPNDKRVPEVARACLAALGTLLLSPIADMSASRGYFTRLPKMHSREMKVLYGTLPL